MQQDILRQSEYGMYFIVLEKYLALMEYSKAIDVNQLGTAVLDNEGRLINLIRL